MKRTDENFEPEYVICQSTEGVFPEYLTRDLETFMHWFPETEIVFTRFPTLSKLTMTIDGGEAGMRTFTYNK